MTMTLTIYFSLIPNTVYLKLEAFEYGSHTITVLHAARLR